MALPAGIRLGSYEILSEIGAGGMGEVYLARDSRLGRDVAIKVLPDTFARDAERTARFEREAKLLATLNHKNIASIHGIEDSNGSLALVMEYAGGPTLADRIHSGPIPLDEALAIARQIADGLEYAHEHGIVHRDLKPANIKVTHDDDVKILDFGLAKAVQVEAESSDLRNSPTITRMATQAGVLLGTAPYMSPEQVKGKPIDRRADIWGFGCVLYEMLTGKMAFHGESVAETLAAILHNEPDWSLLPKDTPIRVRVLLQRCLQKDPKQRLRDIGDARISLDEVLTGAPDPALTGTVLDPSAPSRRALPWALATLVLFVTSAWLAFVHFHKKPAVPAESVRFQIPLPENTNFVTELSVSPDGRHVAFTTAGEGREQLWVHDLDEIAPRLLPTTGNAWTPFWSYDSRTVVFQSGHELERINISGGAPQVICEDSGYNGGAWNPDGVIVFGSSRGLMKVSAAGGEPVLIKSRESIGNLQLGFPTFLPDGHHFLYSASGPTSDATYIGSLDAGENEKPSKPLIAGGALYVPASGDRPASIIFRKPDLSLMAQAFDTSRLELKGDPIPVAEVARRFSVSATNVLAYIGGDTTLRTPLQLTWFDRQGKILGPLGEVGVFASPAISPDGRVVVVTVPDGMRRTTLWLYDLQHGTHTPFTFEGTTNLFPVWSPDGSRIAFLSNPQGSPRTYEKPINGGGKEETFEAAPLAYARPLDWSPDGRYLIEGTGGGTESIWILPLLPEQQRGERKSVRWLPGDSHQSNARLSPNGKWLAYDLMDSNGTGRDEIFVQTFPDPAGGKWQVSTNGGGRPVWSRDGKELYYIDSDGNLMASEVKSRPDGSFDHDAPKVLFKPHIAAGRSEGFDVSKDGRFLIPRVTQQPQIPITVVLNWNAGMK